LWWAVNKEIHEKHALIHAFINEYASLRFLSAGDAHGDIKRTQKYLYECMNDKHCSHIVFTGDYQAEPERNRVHARSNVKQVLREMGKNLDDRIVFVLGGNYELLGVTSEVSLELGEPLFPIGCSTDMLSEGVYPGNYFKNNDIVFIGVEGTNPINQRYPGERTESDLEWALERAVEKASPLNNIIVLITHAPPYNCGSRDSLGAFGLPSTYWGKHVGSTAIKYFLMKYGVFLHVCGHVHEGVGASLCLWRNGNTEINDLKMTAYEAILFIINKRDRSKATLCVNHGTLEFWNYFKFKLAETDNYLLLEVQKRRLGGEDILTKITKKLSLDSRFKYSKIFYFNIDLEDVICEIKK